MKFALAAYGSRGDVEPFAVVARELLRRGHDVRLAVSPDMLAFVESAGLGAVPFGPRMSWQGAGNLAGAVRDVVRNVTRAWAEWDTTLMELAAGADLLFTGQVAQGLAANIAEYHGIPAATLHFFPGGESRPGGEIGRITTDAENAQRRALGLPEAAEASERLEIQAYDEFLFPGVVAEWAEQALSRPFVGALTLELPTDTDAEVLSWIAAGPPPIYFGFGSNVRLPSPGETVAVISAACAQLGERALVCSGASDFANIPWFDNVEVVDAVNHGAVFPACRAVVHQGGAGTTAAGMRAGKATLVLWFGIEDQPIWASAVERLKMGRGRAFSDSTLDSLVADLRCVLEPECLARAREVAAQMTTAEESPSRAADLLEHTARQGGSQR